MKTADFGNLTVSTLQVQPGDVCVVKLHQMVGPEVIKRIQDEVVAVLPKGVGCLVIDETIDIDEMTKAEIEARL